VLLTTLGNMGPLDPIAGSPLMSLIQAKEEALAMLRQVLHISNDDHLRLRQEVRAEQQQGAPLPHPTLQVQASR